MTQFQCDCVRSAWIISQCVLSLPEAKAFTAFVATWQQKLREIAPMCHFSHFTSIFSRRSGTHAKRCWSVEMFWKAVHTQCSAMKQNLERSFAIFAFCVTATANCSANCQLSCESPLALRRTLTHCTSLALYYTSIVLYKHCTTVSHRIALNLQKNKPWSVWAGLLSADCVSRTRSGDKLRLPTSHFQGILILGNFWVS